MSVFKWAAAYTDRSGVLTTELNSLTDGSRTVVGTQIDNGTNLDMFGKLELTVTFASAPSAGAYVAIYMIEAADGSTYEDGSDTVNPGDAKVVAYIAVRATTSAQRLTSNLFALSPAKTKFLLLNKTGQSFPASGSALKLFTANDGV